MFIKIRPLAKLLVITPGCDDETTPPPVVNVVTKDLTVQGPSRFSGEVTVANKMLYDDGTVMIDPATKQAKLSSGTFDEGMNIGSTFSQSTSTSVARRVSKRHHLDVATSSFSQSTTATSVVRRTSTKSLNKVTTVTSSYSDQLTIGSANFKATQIEIADTSDTKLTILVYVKQTAALKKMDRYK